MNHFKAPHVPTSPVGRPHRSLPGRPLSVVDLFCGCGGLSRGLERTGRFKVLLGVDNNRAALDTFVRNHGGSSPPDAHLGDMRLLPKEVVWDALRKLDARKPGDLDLLVGGPPCEGFSRNTVYTSKEVDDAGVTSAAPIKYRESKYWQTAWASKAGSAQGVGRVVRAYNPFLTDPRNLLFRTFLDTVELLRPKVVVIENVRQILTHGNGSIASEIATRLQTLGYVTEARLLNSADYGVPQLRHRAFFLAVRTDIAAGSPALPWPTPTHSGRMDAGPAATPSLFSGGQPRPGDDGFHVTVEDAIGDLPPARPEFEGNPRRPTSDYAGGPLSAFRRFVRSELGTPDNHVHRTPGESVIRRMRAMKPGMRLHDLPEELRTRKFYYNSYGRLAWDRPANTITKSFLYPGSGRFGHPEEERVISYREAARLQSFDDDFTFHATSQEGLASMIGSAVPPLLGFRLGGSIASLIDGLEAQALAS